jgi:hypothetical protein
METANDLGEMSLTLQAALAKREKEQAVIAAARVIASQMPYIDQSDEGGDEFCFYCGASFSLPHTVDCEWLRLGDALDALAA